MNEPSALNPADLVMAVQQIYAAFGRRDISAQEFFDTYAAGEAFKPQYRQQFRNSFGRAIRAKKQ
jgi:hypothetical protein